MDKGDVVMRTVGYYSDFRKEDPDMSDNRMSLQSVVLSEISQTKKENCRVAARARAVSNSQALGDGRTVVLGLGEGRRPQFS